MECAVTYVRSPSEFFCQTGTEKSFDDFLKLEKIIQTYCGSRTHLFHGCDNVDINEILFLKSAVRHGLFVRGRVISKSEEQASCDVELLDYGGDETDVQNILKIDPSVQKFTEIPRFAKKYSLAFIEPTNGAWTDGAVDLFKQYCKNNKLLCLPTGDPASITLIVRLGNSFSDLSEFLIQAGHAKRLGEKAESASTSVSRESLLTHCVGVQTDEVFTGSSVNLVKPPPGFDQTAKPVASNGIKDEEASDKASATKMNNSNTYIPPYRRGNTGNGGSLEVALKLNHASQCDCLICYIRSISREAPNMNRLESILAKDWPELTSKQETVLRSNITGQQLSSRDKEFLLDVLLHFTKKSVSATENSPPLCASLDSSTQVTSTDTRLTLGSYSNKCKGMSVSDEVTIMKQSASKELGSDTNTRDNTIKEPTTMKLSAWGDCIPKIVAEASLETNVRSTDRKAKSGEPAAPNQYRQPTPDYWSDGLSDSDSSTDFVRKDYTNTTASGPSADIKWQKGAKSFGFTTNQSTAAHHKPNTPRSSPLKQSTGFQPKSEKAKSLGSTPVTTPTRPTRKDKSLSPSRVLTYGLSLSGTRPTRPLHDEAHFTGEPVKHDFGGFGKIMYCTFCGATSHPSAECPDGTKNLFLN